MKESVVWYKVRGGIVTIGNAVRITLAQSVTIPGFLAGCLAKGSKF